MTSIATTQGATTTAKYRNVLAAILVSGALASHVTEAQAVSPAVKAACLGDYLANCSAHSVGSPGLRRCMRAVGSRLSKGCINALVATGEVSKAEVQRRATAAAH